MPISNNDLVTGLTNMINSMNFLESPLFFALFMTVVIIIFMVYLLHDVDMSNKKKSFITMFVSVFFITFVGIFINNTIISAKNSAITIDDKKISTYINGGNDTAYYEGNNNNSVNFDPNNLQKVNIDGL